MYRTLFGKLRLNSSRFSTCSCQGVTPRASISPLAERVPERTAPELVYLESKFAARDWNELPRPDPPLTVGLDGVYVHACHPSSRTEGWFEVIVGKSQPDEGAAKRFAFVTTYDAKSKRRLFETLKSQGLRMNQQVTFPTDGGDTVRELPLYLCPESEHWLDWLHVTMRRTVMSQMVRALALEQVPAVPMGEGESVPGVAGLEKQLESLKWHLWHGNVDRALQIAEDLECDLDSIVHPTERVKKLIKAVNESHHDIEINRASIPNYGDRYRHGEAIASSFVESTVNQVVSKRMVKKQQMPWTQRVAHLLLQVRTPVLDDLRADFERWYPGLKTGKEPTHDAAA